MQMHIGLEWLSVSVCRACSRMATFPGSTISLILWMDGIIWMGERNWKEGVVWGFFSFNLTSWFYISVVMQSSVRPHTLSRCPFYLLLPWWHTCTDGAITPMFMEYTEANGNQPSISHKQKYVKVSSSSSSDARKLVTSLRYSCLPFTHRHSDEAL